ncbi:hypothetical protein WJS89_01065 [Sphingomicrobium sp. XHP0235]|uniref:hypothetical protein n=1 Tax=Sphingomicrobium aquimarinum TaxID=3133971 RepID=UPI0031FE8BF5
MKRLIFCLVACIWSSGAMAQDRDDDQEGVEGQQAIVIEGEALEDDDTIEERTSPVAEPRSKSLMGSINLATDGTSKRGPYFGIDSIDWEAIWLQNQFSGYDVLYRYGMAGYVANCAVASIGDRAAAYVSERPEDGFDSISKAFLGRHRHCLTSAAAGAPTPLINAALAEIIVTRRIVDVPDRSETIDVEAANRFIHEEDSVGDSDIATVARCLAVVSPGRSLAVLREEPMSEEESTALRALYSASPECGLKDTPDLHPVYQRNAIAMALFRWYRLG